MPEVRTKFNLRVVLSDRCNYKCSFCTLDFSRARNIDIRPNFLADCITVFARIGGTRVHYSGGEPLLYPCLKDALCLSKALGLNSGVTTNGSLLGLKSNNLVGFIDKLNVSMPAFDQEAYARVTGSCGVDLERIKADVVRVSRSGVGVKINAVYLEGHEETLQGIVRYFSAYGITTKIMNDMFGDEAYYRRFLRYAAGFLENPYVEIEKALNPGLSICRDCRVSKKGSCPSCRSIWVYPDGRITVCPRNPSMDFYCTTKEEAERAIRSCWEMD